MLETNTGPVKSRYPGFQKAVIRQLRTRRPSIDMTPMVDLGFLLISFFVVTAVLQQPTSMNLNMPKDSSIPTPIEESDALTILLDGDSKTYYYSGSWEHALQNQSIHQISSNQLKKFREIIINKQNLLQQDPSRKEGKHGIMLIIKPTGSSSYKQVVDILDEVAINGIKKYAIVKLSTEEMSWLAGRQ
jgi:biopolymer transport protein ExbD